MTNVEMTDLPPSVAETSSWAVVSSTGSAAEIDTLITPTASPSKTRSLSDVTPILSPSPKFREAVQSAQDDISVFTNPTTPRRPTLLARTLSLQIVSESVGPAPSSQFTRAPPLSPQLDCSHIYGSPTSALPRRSRGLDFSRACTNLHHSTLAEQTSPDASPTQTKGMMIPPRKGMPSTPGTHEGGSSQPSSFWSSMGHPDRSGRRSSVGSQQMTLDSDSSAGSSDDAESAGVEDGGDPIITTPQVYKLSDDLVPYNPASPFAPASRMLASPGGDRMGRYSPVAASLMSFQRARLGRGRRRRSRNSSSSASASASGNSSMASPSPASPPAMKSSEAFGGIHAARDISHRMDISRRSSLNWGTRELHLSSGGESDESGANTVGLSVDGHDVMTAASPSGVDGDKRPVIRRAVTRRGNLLDAMQPKSKNFDRIRAALMEEGAPIETEVQREAEVVRQVRESEPEPDFVHHRSCLAETEGSSPTTTLPTVPGLHELDDPLDEDRSMSDRDRRSDRGPPETFTLQVKRHSGGKDFWDAFDRTHTPPPPPPPPPFFARGSSSAMSEDTYPESPLLLGAPASSLASVGQPWHPNWQTSGAGTPLPPTPLELSRPIGGKRRREDNFDPASFKRRAVSPGMSLQNSPILTQSPASKEGGGWWGLSGGGNRAMPSSSSTTTTTHTTMPSSSHAPAGPTDRTHGQSGGNASGGATTGGTKRVGLQGMNDTYDGLMAMSIE